MSDKMMQMRAARKNKAESKKQKKKKTNEKLNLMRQLKKHKSKTLIKNTHNDDNIDNNSIDTSDLHKYSQTKRQQQKYDKKQLYNERAKTRQDNVKDDVKKQVKFLTTFKGIIAQIKKLIEPLNNHNDNKSILFNLHVVYQLIVPILQQYDIISPKITQCRNGMNDNLTSRMKKNHIKEIDEIILWKCNNNNHKFNEMLQFFIDNHIQFVNEYFQSKFILNLDETKDYLGEGKFTRPQMRFQRVFWKRRLGWYLFKNEQATEQELNNMLPKTGRIDEFRIIPTQSSISHEKHGDGHINSSVWHGNEKIILGNLITNRINNNLFEIRDVCDEKIYAFWGGDKSDGGYVESVSADICESSHSKHNSLATLLTKHHFKDNFENLNKVYNGFDVQSILNELLLFPIAIIITQYSKHNDVIISKQSEVFVFGLDTAAQNKLNINYQIDEKDQMIAPDINLQDDHNSVYLFTFSYL